MEKNNLRPAVDGYCPLCDRKYTIENNRTKHHLFPKYWYSRNGTVGPVKIGITVYACHECHEVEFNHLYPMILNQPWSKSECIINWIKFCYSKGKEPLRVYPQLDNLFT